MPCCGAYRAAAGLGARVGAVGVPCAGITAARNVLCPVPVCSPLRSLLQQRHAAAIVGSPGSAAYVDVVAPVVERVAAGLHDAIVELLATERSMDASLQWLSTSTDGAGAGAPGAASGSDSDKIRRQFSLDAAALAEQATTLLGARSADTGVHGAQADTQPNTPSLQRLRGLATDAT